MSNDAPVLAGEPVRADASPVATGYRTYVLVILTLVYVVNYLDRQILGILMPQIQKEFSLTDADLGLLGGTAFAVLYAVLGVPIAVIADRVNRRNVVAISLTVFSFMTLISGYAAQFWQLLLARFGTGIGEAGTSRLDRFRELAILAGEQHLLPAPQFIAQFLVALRLAGLPLQRAALLLHFEDDVVDAGEVLLRGIELEFGGAPAGLVLRDARGFFDQRATLGRTRRQDLADLALLDHGVRLHAEPRVHQQIVNVAQTADFTVDQIFALARTI